MELTETLRPRRAITVALVALAAVQVAIIGSRAGIAKPQQAGVAMIELGDSLGSIRTVGLSGGSSVLALGGVDPTLLLAFDTACAWCDVVAPKWSEKVRALPGVRTVGITRSPLASALRYAEKHGWDFDTIVQVDASESARIEKALTGRTPWIFLLDSAGRIKMIDHGENLDRALADVAVTASGR